ncbi:MAG: hypothetical protein WDM77_22015 [Steroidobacteraceae bacterium]
MPTAFLRKASAAVAALPETYSAASTCPSTSPAYRISTSAWGPALGQDGGSGGDGHAVTVRNTASISTTGVGSFGIFAQSVGGGGGVAGGLGNDGTVATPGARLAELLWQHRRQRQWRHGLRHPDREHHHERRNGGRHLRAKCRHAGAPAGMSRSP